MLQHDARLQRQQLLSMLLRLVQVVTKPCARARPDTAREHIQPEIAHLERRRPLGTPTDLGQDQAVCLVGIRCLLVRFPTRPLRRLELQQRLVHVLRLLPQTCAQGGGGGGGSGEGSADVEVSASAGAGDGAGDGADDIVGAGAGAGADAGLLLRGSGEGSADVEVNTGAGAGTGTLLLLLALDPLVGLLGDGGQLLLQLLLPPPPRSRSTLWPPRRWRPGPAPALLAPE